MNSSAKGVYVRGTVSKHLKPVNYDHRARLYWKRKLEEGLSAAESGELAALERENMKTIEEVYES